MEFLHLYILVFAAYFSAAGAMIIRVTTKKSKLNTKEKNFIDDFVAKKEYELERAKIGVTIKDYFLIMLVVPVILMVGCYFMFPDNQIITLICIPVGLYMPEIIIKKKKNEQDKDFSDRFSKALGQMASSLNSGMSFERAIEDVVNNELMHPSIRSDFQYLLAKVKLGTPIAKAFQEFADYTKNEDVQDTALTISIMMQIGKGEGQAIKEIQQNIESRLLYRKKRASMLAETKLMILFGDLIPPAILAAAFLFMPGLMGYYFETSSSLAILIFIVFLLFVGSFVSHKMAIQKKDIS